MGFVSSTMAVSTVAQRKKNLFELLSNDKVKRIVLYGKAAVGKTWTAREISNLAKKKGLIDVALWVFLNTEYEKDTLRDSIAHQLSLLSTTGELEADNDNKESKEENQGDLKQRISDALSGKKLLLVLDDEKTNEQQMMFDLGTLLNLDQRDYKVLITKRESLNSDSSEDGETSVIEVKPLSEEESFSLLQERAGTSAFVVPEIKDLANDFLGKTKNMPAAIIMMAKAFSYVSKQGSGVQMLKRSLEEVPDDEIYNITHLLRSGYDLLPNSVLIDCFWGGSHFFHDCRRIHYNELIAYWVMEGFLGHTNCMEKAYEKGHVVLMELMDCQILRKVEADYVVMDGPTLNLDEILKEREMITSDHCYRHGFSGTASLGLANVHGDGKWEGLGRITQKDGVIKAPHSGKQGQKSSILLLDGNSLSRHFRPNFSESHQELRVLALFNPTFKNFSLFPYEMNNLCVLLLRGCHFMEKIDRTLNFEKLTVLEISGPSFLTEIPDDLFKSIPHLRSLNLSRLDFVSLPSSFYELSELSWLILRECSHLTELGSVKKFTNLMVIDLSGSTSLSSIQDKSFSSNKELQMINFSKTNIKSLPLIFSLKKLTHLLLSGCLEVDRLRSITSVATLQILDLSDACNFKEFHDQSLANLTDLKILDLSRTAVDHLPSNVSNPHHLYLNGCTSLSKLECIELLTDLETLDFSKAQVKTLPSLSHLHNMRQLLLSCCSNLEELPDLNSLTKLEVLDLSGCRALTVLQDKSFEQMSQLWKLDLSETTIKRLPSLSNLINLRHLLLKKCTSLSELPPLDSLSKLEKLNLRGIGCFGETGADFLKKMDHLQILDLSETLLKRLPSMSNLKNLHQLYIRGCPDLTTVPGLKELTKLEVLDLSETAVDDLPSLDNFSNLRQLLLRDCPGLKEFLQLEVLHLLGATVCGLPYGISKLTNLEHLVLPGMKDTQGAVSSMTKEPNQYGWGISSLPVKTVGNNNKPPLSLSSSQFLQLMKNNQSLWTSSFKQFHLSIHPIEEQDTKGVVPFYMDDFMFGDIYFKIKQFCDFEEQQSLEIRGFQRSPKGIKEVLSLAEFVFLIDNAFESWLSDLGASNFKVLKGCWIERCKEMESVFHAEEIEEVAKVESLEVLWVSNSLNLKCIYPENWQSHTFQNLKCLYLDCCPKLSFVFSSYQLPKNLQVLQIKFCDKLKAVFEGASPKPKLPKLDTLYLWELPELKSIGCVLPSQGPAGNVSDTNVVSLSVYSTGAALLASCNKRNEKSIELKEKYSVAISRGATELQMNKIEIFSVNYDLKGDLNLLKVQYFAMLGVVENQEDVLFEHHSLKAA
ncbi:unnamed protein product [Camellia sinensis]